MNIFGIRKLVASYMQIPVEDFSTEENDLILQALNEARKEAERSHEWVCQMSTIKLSHSTGTGSWAVGVTETDGLSVSVKQPEAFYIRKQGDEEGCPVPHTTKKNENSNTYDQARYGGMVDRYPRDGEGSYNGDILKVILHGHCFRFNTKLQDNIEVLLDCYKWLPEYINDTDTDFFTEHGYDYLKWSALVKTNYKFETFVHQQEGTLGPPEKYVASSLASLQELDSFMLEGSRIL